jgi:UDP-glucuronate 4-epimerase
MTRILITGAAGFIGSHLAERLVAEGHEITGLDAFDTTLYDAARKQQNLAALLAGPRFRLVRGDLLDAPLVAGLVAGQDVVVHLAALAGVRPSLLAPARYARTNVEGTVNVLEACRAAGVRRLVFASSSSVYGARGAAAAFREDDPCLTPASPYAASKRAGELHCSTYRDLFGIGVSCLRFFTVYGPRQRGDMAIHKFTRAIAAGKPVTLFDGDSARDYTYIDDIIDGTAAATHRVQPGAFNLYNLGGTHVTGLIRLVEMIGDALGRRPEILRGEPQPGDVPITWSDVSRSEVDLVYGI